MTTPTDYTQGKIYSIHLPGMEEICYIGSTVKELHKRFSEHKYSTNNKYQFASCVFFTEGNDPVITLLEAYPCETKQQLLEREKHWQDQFPDRVNKHAAILTEEQRLERGREIALRCYYKNQAHNIERNKLYKQTHAAEIAEHRHGRKDIEAAQAKARFDAGYKDVRNAKKREKALCPTCGKEMNKNSIPLHLKSVHK
jgi:hypothetical protein